MCEGCLDVNTARRIGRVETLSGQNLLTTTEKYAISCGSRKNRLTA